MRIGRHDCVRMRKLNLHSPHMPHSMSSLGIWHDADEIDPDHIWVDFHFVYIHIRCTTKRSTLHDTERIEWMSMTLITSISYFDKDNPFSISCDDIDLSSLYLIIPLENMESFSFEILDREFLSLISDASSGRFFWFCHCEHSETIQEIIRNYQPKTHSLFFSEILASGHRDLLARGHSRLSLSENRTYLPYHSDLLPSRVHGWFFIH